MNLRQHVRGQAPETRLVVSRCCLAALVSLVSLVTIRATSAVAQPTTNCRQEASNRDPLSGAEAWSVETCTTTNRVTGELIKVQTCTTNRRYATTECVDQPVPQAPAPAGPASAPQTIQQKSIQNP